MYGKKVMGTRAHDRPRRPRRQGRARVPEGEGRRARRERARLAVTSRSPSPPRGRGTSHAPAPKRRPKRPGETTRAGKRGQGRRSAAPRAWRSEGDPSRSLDVDRPRSPRLDLVDPLVLEVHGLVHDQGWLADRALERMLRRERGLFANERRAVAESVYGIIRWQGQLDLPPRPGAVARAAVRGLARPLRRALAPQDGRAPPRRLRGGARARSRGPGADARLAAVADPVERLAARGLAPALDRGALHPASSGSTEARALAAGDERAGAAHVRANTPPRDARRRSARGSPTRASRRSRPASPRGASSSTGTPTPSRSRPFQEGLFEIQDEGSQLVALACGARPGWTVVDACAGAGGKSLALAAEMHNKGSLHALDTDEERLDEARRRARRARRPQPADARSSRPGPEADAQLADLAGKARPGARRRALQRPRDPAAQARRALAARARAIPTRFAAAPARRSCALRAAARAPAGGSSTRPAPSAGRRTTTSPSSPSASSGSARRRSRRSSARSGGGARRATATGCSSTRTGTARTASSSPCSSGRDRRVAVPTEPTS